MSDPNNLRTGETFGVSCIFIATISKYVHLNVADAYYIINNGTALPCQIKLC